MGEIIGLPTAITYYPKHKNIHSSDERTEIKHTFFSVACGILRGLHID
ncbi:Uncharacterised protein [Klebsiella pneumoniae]|nr:Uncharacterised protein [Klebsiella pneumoniae]VGC85786.1 Uncharacterised protein [Klebsiella pneumoniae]VGI56998.1 Uncharacterised protein [Klebsiella pneumoniae]